MPSAASYPVHVEASLDPRLSRWLWLVKWVLAIPHYLILLALWVAFAVLSVVAFFGILFTGRYPRAIFDFNVGVLRWSWRVGFYSYDALATDRYPPFTLAEVPDYPAHLEIDYPEHLSRGLVLVKWWLLAIPHYIIVGFFAGGGTWLAWQAGNDHQAGWGGGGLIGILTLVAAITLAVTGRYPGTVFDFLLGMNRWVLRVAAYAGLMTDAYPPFRLDLGGHEPGGTLTLPGGAGPAAPEDVRQEAPAAEPEAPVAGREGAGPQKTDPQQTGGGRPDLSKGQALPPAPAAPPAPVRGGTGWSAGRIVAVVIGSILVLGSFGLGSSGAALLWADQTQRDGGYLTSPTMTYGTGGYALASDRFDLRTGPWSSAVGDIRIRATALGSSKPMFVGLAPANAADQYLSGVRRTTVTDLGDNGRSTVEHQGAAPSAPPMGQDFWVAKVTGTGTQSLVVPAQNGRWTVVIMNADGSPGLAVRTDVGATLPAVTGISVALIVSAVVALAVGCALIVFAVRRVSPAPADSPGPVPAAGGPGGAPGSGPGTV